MLAALLTLAVLNLPATPDLPDVRVSASPTSIVVDEASQSYQLTVDDLDGDWVRDRVVGTTRPGTSFALVLSGSDGRRLHLFTASQFEAFALRVVDAEDVDGDGAADPRIRLNRGERVLVLSGRSGELLYSISSPDPLREAGPASFVPDSGSLAATWVNGQRVTRSQTIHVKSGFGGPCPPACSPITATATCGGAEGAPLRASITNQSACDVRYDWVWLFIPNASCPTLPATLPGASGRERRPRSGPDGHDQRTRNGAVHHGGRLPLQVRRALVRQPVPALPALPALQCHHPVGTLADCRSCASRAAFRGNHGTRPPVRSPPTSRRPPVPRSSYPAHRRRSR